MNKSRIISLFVLILFSISLAYADPTLPGTCSAFRPEVLSAHIIKESQLQAFLKTGKSNNKSAWGQTTNTNTYWNVFSDRSNNITYRDPQSNSQEYKKLEFGQELRIADIQNGFALVYEERLRGQIYPKISSAAVSMGWIPMKNLLLWTDCPANENYIYKKALIVGNIDNARDDSRLGYIFKNPETNDGKRHLQSTMNFFYQMKEDNGMILLSTESRVGGRIKTLYGWVSKASFVAWEQRTCIEPNWDRQVINELHGVSIPVTSKTNGKEITSVVLGLKENSIPNYATKYRLDPEILRFPVLGVEKGKTYDATIFAKEGKATNPTVLKTADVPVSTLEALKIVNIIVVIDGTRGMEKFFPYAMEAVKRAVGYFKEDITVKIGGVIYRDYPNGSNVTEILPMSRPNDSKVENFFKGGSYGVRSVPNDRTDYEALYKGLEVALDSKKMGYSKNNCNLMFVIGDAGNDPNDKQCLLQEQIINRCVENKIQLSSFLVRNIDTPASAQFGKQMRTIVMKNMERQYAERIGKDIKGTYNQLSDGYDFTSGIEEKERFFIGGFRKAAQGQDMDESRLYSLVRSTSERFEKSMEKIREILDRAKEIATTEDGGEAASVIEEKLLVDILGQSTYNALKETKYIMAFEGKVPQKANNGTDYWKPVIYISHPEFLKLMEQLKPVMEAVEVNPEDRKPYINAMKGLVTSMLPGVSEQMMMKMDNKEIMAQILGLNVRTQSLERYPLVDIQNTEAVTNEQFQGLVSDFIESYRKLEDIQQRKYPFKVRRNNVDFYWIPAEDMP